jgi:Ni,Fe-hydrogenase maturation factor
VKTLLLGLGNELYGHDGIAIQVVRRFKEEGGQKERAATPRNRLEG